MITVIIVIILIFVIIMGITGAIPPGPDFGSVVQERQVRKAYKPPQCLYCTTPYRPSFKETFCVGCGAPHSKIPKYLTPPITVPRFNG